MLAWLLSGFTGFLAPLIILFVKRDSKFVKFQSAQALFLDLGYILLAVVCVVALFGSVAATILHAPMDKSAPQHLPVAFFFFPAFYLAIILAWMTKLIIGIAFAIRVNDGHWARFPLLHRLAAVVAGV